MPLSLGGALCWPLRSTEKNRVLQIPSRRFWRREQESQKQLKTRSQLRVAHWPQRREACWSLAGVVLSRQRRGSQAGRGAAQDTPGADFSVCGALPLPWMAHTSTHSDGRSALPGLGEAKPERSLQLTNVSTPPPFPIQGWPKSTSVAWWGSRWRRGLSHSLVWYCLSRERPAPQEVRPRSTTHLSASGCQASSSSRLTRGARGRGLSGLCQGGADHVSARACVSGPQRGRRKRLRCVLTAVSQRSWG